MMLSLESLAYKADDAGGEFNAAQREVGCQQSCWKVEESPLLSTKIITVLIGYCDYNPVTKLPKIGSCD